MSTVVVYYSRSGNSKKVADILAQELGVEPIRLEGQISEEDEIILVVPLWAGDVAVEAHSFIEKHDKKAIRMVVLSKASELKNQERFKSVHMVKESKTYDQEYLKAMVNKI